MAQEKSVKFGMSASDVSCSVTARLLSLGIFFLVVAVVYGLRYSGSSELLWWDNVFLKGSCVCAQPLPTFDQLV